MNEIEIKINNGVAELYTPYNPQFVQSIKERIGGRRWDGVKRCWTVPESAVDSVRAIMVEVFGESDISSDEKVTVKVVFKDLMIEYRGGITIFGKVVASASGRDSGARIGAGCDIIKGSAHSGGSMKNWHTEIDEGTEIIMHDVNRSMIKDAPDKIEYEIIETENSKAKSLNAEKAKLLARIAEIDKELSELQQ